MGNSFACQWEGALFEQFRAAVFGYMFSQNYDPFGPVNQVHGTAHSLHELAWNNPISQIAF